LTLGYDSKDWWLPHMISIRIAIAAVLATAAVGIGGAAHAAHSQPSTGQHSTVLALRAVPQDPILCCE
jgi:hypothetical protein